MENNFELIKTTDKAQRDTMFDDFRANGNPLEKQCVKYSGVDPDPEHAGHWITVWYVAYPRN